MVDIRPGHQEVTHISAAGFNYKTAFELRLSFEITV